MTESEWLGCDEPQKIVAYLCGKKLERKLRLFGCAFCRSIWNLLDEECFRNAVEIAERFADGQATAKELFEAKQESGAALERSGLRGVSGTPQNAKGCAWSTTRDPGSAAMYPLWVFTTTDDTKTQLAHLRDIFGNPFHPPAVDSAWLSPQVQELAQDIYAQRSFGRLPVLADVLEKAACRDPVIQSHCRQPGPHVRGCWLLDLLLGHK